MKKDNSFYQWLEEKSELAAESIPGKSIIELCGDCRVLIENHRGVKVYSKDKIAVKTGFGEVIVCGCNMELSRMTKDQLLILGKIDGVSVVRGRG